MCPRGCRVSRYGHGFYNSRTANVSVKWPSRWGWALAIDDRTGGEGELGREKRLLGVVAGKKVLTEVDRVGGEGVDGWNDHQRGTLLTDMAMGLTVPAALECKARARIHRMARSAQGTEGTEEWVKGGWGAFGGIEGEQVRVFGPNSTGRTGCGTHEGRAEMTGRSKKRARRTVEVDRPTDPYEPT